MKPTKNRIFCVAARRTKMVFETQGKADNFIKFNADNIAQNSEFVPIRSYYCTSCAGWHVTHKSDNDYYQQMDRRDEDIYLLIKKVNDLETCYKDLGWQALKERIDKIKEESGVLNEDPRFMDLAKEVKKKLQRYNEEVNRLKNKERRRETDRANKAMGTIKRVFDELNDSIKNLDIKQCKSRAEHLVTLLQSPTSEMLGEKKRITYTRTSDCFINPLLCEKIARLMTSVREVKDGEPLMDTPHLQEEIGHLVNMAEELNECKIQENVYNLLYAEVLGLLKMLRRRDNRAVVKATRTEGYEDHLRYCEDHLQMIETALANGEKSTVQALLRSMDERMKSIPLNPQKLDLLRRFLLFSENNI